MGLDKLCKSILIAEDNDDVREALEMALKTVGYMVFTAKNGKDALKKLKSTPTPTLVLLDLMMPVMNGWEFLAAQKADAVFATYPVITLSAVSPSLNAQEIYPSIDLEKFMQKPVDLDDLLGKVERFCGKP